MRCVMCKRLRSSANLHWYTLTYNLYPTHTPILNNEHHTKNNSLYTTPMPVLTQYSKPLSIPTQLPLYPLCNPITHTHTTTTTIPLPSPPAQALTWPTDSGIQKQSAVDRCNNIILDSVLGKSCNLSSSQLQTQANACVEDVGVSCPFLQWTVVKCP